MREKFKSNLESRRRGGAAKKFVCCAVHVFLFREAPIVFTHHDPFVKGLSLMLRRAAASPALLAT